MFRYILGVQRGLRVKINNAWRVYVATKNKVDKGGFHIVALPKSFGVSDMTGVPQAVWHVRDEGKRLAQSKLKTARKTWGLVVESFAIQQIELVVDMMTALPSYCTLNSGRARAISTR